MAAAVVLAATAAAATAATAVQVKMSAKKLKSACCSFVAR